MNKEGTMRVGESSRALLMAVFLGLIGLPSGALCQGESSSSPMATPASAPRLILAGRGISTYDVIRIREPGEEDITSSRVDFADASLLFQFDTRRESGARGGFLLGLQFPDPDVELGTVYFHEIGVFLDAGRWSVRIGRSALPNTMITFPTLRDDDLIDYAYVRNAFSSGRATELSQFGNVMRGDFYFEDRRLRVSACGSNLPITDRSGVVENAFELNAGSVQVQYELPESARSETALRKIGATLFSQKVATEDQEWIHALIGGALFDINTNPIDHFDLRLQGIFNFGTDLASVDGIDDRALSSYESFVGSMRYLRSPGHSPRLQAAFTFGYQQYADVEASRYSLIPSFVYRLQNQVDLLAQYKYEAYRKGLEDAIGYRDRATIWLGLGYDFEARFNDRAGARDEVLGFGHEYLP
jgi:hypothetical protein